MITAFWVLFWLECLSAFVSFAFVAWGDFPRTLTYSRAEYLLRAFGAAGFAVFFWMVLHGGFL